MTASAPDTAFSNPCRSAARRAETPLAVATATKRSKPASRKAGSSVPVEKAPAPIQPTPGWARPTGLDGRPGGAAGAPAGPGRRGVRVRRGRIGEADRQAGLGPLVQEPVGLVRAADVEGVGDQVGHREPARGEQVEHGFLVPALGPAHLPGRVVDPPGLVGRLVPARPVGAGEQQRDLPLVVRGAARRHAHVTHHHHGGPVPAQRRCPRHRLGRLAGGAHQHGVRAPAPGPVQDLARGRVTGLVQGQDARAGRGVPGEPVRVDPGHVAAGGHRQPRRELAEQPEAEHHDLGARSDPGQAQRVQRDGREGGERRVLRRHPFRHDRAQQAGHGLELGVAGLARRRPSPPAGRARSRRRRRRPRRPPRPRSSPGAGRRRAGPGPPAPRPGCPRPGPCARPGGPGPAGRGPWRAGWTGRAR